MFLRLSIRACVLGRGTAGPGCTIGGAGGVGAAALERRGGLLDGGYLGARSGGGVAEELEMETGVGG